jgi:hypothetical protein
MQTLIDASILDACQDAPAVQALLSVNVLSPGILLVNPIEFILAAEHNLLNFLQRVTLHLTFNPTFQSGWLPPLTQSPHILVGLNVAVKYLLGGLIAISHLLAFAVAFISLLRRRLTTPIVFAVLLSVADLVNAALYNRQNFYAGIQYIPNSMIIMMLLFQCLPKNLFSSFLRVCETIMMVFMAILASISLMMLVYLMVPSMMRNAVFPQSTIPGQPISIPVFNTKAHLDSIRELGKLCHIPEQSAQFVAVDQMTYFAYIKDLHPVHVLYVSELAYGQDLGGGKLLPFLKRHGSPGLITRCEWVPNEMRGSQKQNQLGYCCVGFGGD